MNLRHRIRIERKVLGRASPSKNVTETWETLYDRVPAEITPMTGRELVAAAQTRAQVDTWIKIRWASGVLPSMRIVHADDGGRVYQIKAVLHDPSFRRFIKLMCSTGVSLGQ